jgi:hypothetical protein
LRLSCWPQRAGSGFAAVGKPHLWVSGRHGPGFAAEDVRAARSGHQPRHQGLIFGAGWEYVGKTGESLEATTPEAASCSFNAPLGMKPNRSYNFDLVLDVPQDTSGGVIVFDPSRNGGWEWPLS